MIEYFFINKEDFKETEYEYSDFDNIVAQFGYRSEKKGSLHRYFEWNGDYSIFKYNKCTNEQLRNTFIKTFVFQRNIEFYIRISTYKPLIQMSAQKLAVNFDNLCCENGDMGWEAISVCGKFILEFTDSYELCCYNNFRWLCSG